MIERSQLLSLSFYEKEKFKGSYCGMCYLIEARRQEKKEENAKALWSFCVTLWPGPLCFEKTPKELKQTKEYPPREKLSEEDLLAITAYLNEQYKEQKALWDTARYY